MNHPEILLKAPHALFIKGVWARPHTERKLNVILSDAGYAAIGKSIELALFK